MKELRVGPQYACTALCIRFRITKQKKNTGKIAKAPDSLPKHGQIIWNAEIQVEIQSRVVLEPRKLPI